MYNAYKERMLATSEVLAKELPKGCSFLAPGGGYFIWVSLPSSCNASEFLKVCIEEENIFFITGSRFAAAAGEATNSLRLSIAFHEKAKLEDAAYRICRCLKKFLKLFSFKDIY